MTSNSIEDLAISSLISNVADTIAKLSYDQTLLAEDTNMPTNTEALPLCRPMLFGIGYPDSWLFNVRIQHYDITGLCHCAVCYQNQHPHLFVGDPVQVGSSSVETMRMEGLVGLYTSPPVYTYECAACGEVIETDSVVESDSEMIHVDCLPEADRNSLLAIGYCPKSIERKKRPDDDTNREMVIRQSDNECTEQGSPEDGGESVQGNGKEKGTMVQAGGNGTSERPEQSGLDVHIEQASEGAREEPGEEGSGEETSNAEEDTSGSSVLHTSGDDSNTGG